MNIPVKEGREKLERILSTLVDAPECYIPVRGPWVPLSDAQTANWDARQTIGRLKREGFADLEEITDVEEPVYAVLSPAEDRALLEPHRVLIEAKQSNLFS